MQFAGISDSEPEAAGTACNTETPAKGTLLWLVEQSHIDVRGRSLPSVHRIPEGSTWRSDEERGTRCALIRPDGRPCGAPAVKRYGVCLVHCGGGAYDLAAMSALGVAKLGRLRLKRELLGIGPARSGNPRQVARVAAAERADELALALLAPLDDRRLSSMEKQRAAVTAIDATFPLQSTTVDLELPTDAGEIGAMGWEAMQQLAARLLD